MVNKVYYFPCPFSDCTTNLREPHHDTAAVLPQSSDDHPLRTAGVPRPGWELSAVGYPVTQPGWEAKSPTPKPHGAEASQLGPLPQQKWLSLQFYQRGILTREMVWNGRKRYHWKSGSDLVFDSSKPWHCLSSVLAVSTTVFSVSTPPHLPEVFENPICSKGLREDSNWRKRGKDWITFEWFV